MNDVARPDYEAHDDLPCRERDPDSYFTRDDKAYPHAARLLCSGCPLLEECRQYAVDSHQEGIWGGVTTDERRSMRRSQARTVAVEHPCRQSTTCYRDGCRNQVCVDAHRNAQHQARAARLADGRLQHGNAGYNDGCRCDVCRAAKRVSRRGAA